MFYFLLLAACTAAIGAVELSADGQSCTQLKWEEYQLNRLHLIRHLD